MSAARRAVGALIAAAAALGLAAASRVPMRVHADERARLRVAFSARPERIERCRAVDPEELAKLPAHMRQNVVCEGTTAQYRLEIRHADSVLATALLRGGGLRHDRRLYVLRELPIPPGVAVIDVRLTRIDTVSAPGSAVGGPESGPGDPAAIDRARREVDERRRRVEDEVPSSLFFTETVTLAPREVMLVTYDQDARRFRMVRGARIGR